MKKTIILFLPVLAFLIFSFRPEKNAPPKFTISGTIWMQEDVCEGVNPQQEDFRTITAAANTTIYIRTAGTTKVLDSATSNDRGLYAFYVPAGGYEIIAQWKTYPLVMPENTATKTWDTACYSLSYREADHYITLKENVSEVDVILYAHCDWNQPCCTYTGPMPQQQPPKNRGGYQPGHQE